MKDPAEAMLHGDVRPAVAGGVLRYRLWPAKRHPLWTALGVLAVGGATWATEWALGSWVWAAFVFLGAVATGALFLFPTEVGLDGSALHIRHLGTPRTYDLRRFRRMEVSGRQLRRVELTTRARFSPLDPVESVVIPLPEHAAAAESALVHLRRWVGRQPTGRFEIDSDHAPEDNVE